MSASLEWHKAPSGTGYDARFAFGVMQIRQRFGDYQVVFIPFPEFDHVQESATDRNEREDLFRGRYDLGTARAVAQGVAIGMAERDIRATPVEDPIIRQIVDLLNRKSHKLSKSEILSLTGMNETQWQFFLTHRPEVVSLESHGRGARYGIVGKDYTEAQPPANVPGARFSDFVGNPTLRDRLRQFVTAAASRNEPLDHTLLSGPPGVGKTLLAEIIAGEMGRPLYPFWSSRVPNIDDALNGIPDGAVVFIDEIHALSPTAQEQLYAHMRRPITVIGATNYPSRLLPAFQERFKIRERLDLYSVQELATVITRADKNVSKPIATEIAKRSRGTPREALRLLRRLSDLGGLKQETIGEAFDKLEIDSIGLSSVDRAYLRALAQANTPTGLDALATTLSESADVLEQQVEPFLLQQGFIERGPRGRSITEKGRTHLTQEGRRSGRGRNGKAPKEAAPPVESSPPQPPAPPPAPPRAPPPAPPRAPEPMQQELNI